MDNVIERLRRSSKYEWAYTHAFDLGLARQLDMLDRLPQRGPAAHGP